MERRQEAVDARDSLQFPRLGITRNRSIPKPASDPTPRRVRICINRQIRIPLANPSATTNSSRDCAVGRENLNR
jgi:hypothetical protein